MATANTDTVRQIYREFDDRCARTVTNYGKKKPIKQLSAKALFGTLPVLAMGLLTLKGTEEFLKTNLACP